MDNQIIVVSGLPRCGTSLMMQMLDYGGVPVVTDHIRTADQDNPRGYYEFERVKKLKEDVSWLPAARGKALKMVSQLLHELPSNERYRIVFMERDLDEMLDSQEKMLTRLNKPSAPREAVAQAFRRHLRRVRTWLLEQPNFRVLFVNYNDLLERTDVHAGLVSEFLDGKADAASMLKAIDPSLYRNRRTPIDCSSDPAQGS